MTNDEIRRNDEIRMTKPANAPLRVFRHSGFGFLSSFVIQRLMQFRFMVPMHAKNETGDLHEPLWISGQIFVAYATNICPRRFIVPMHAEKTKEGFP